VPSPPKIGATRKNARADFRNCIPVILLGFEYRTRPPGEALTDRFAVDLAYFSLKVRNPLSIIFVHDTGKDAGEGAP
jgi:hypothetical protein